MKISSKLMLFFITSSVAFSALAANSSDGQGCASYNLHYASRATGSNQFQYYIKLVSNDPNIPNSWTIGPNNKNADAYTPATNNGDLPSFTAHVNLANGGQPVGTCLVSSRGGIINARTIDNTKLVPDFSCSSLFGPIQIPGTGSVCKVPFYSSLKK